MCVEEVNPVDYIAFEIKNFKGIRDLRIDLDISSRVRIATLVGLNESGKTTILEAIDHFDSGSEALDPKQLSGRIRPQQNDLIPISERANFNGKLSIKAFVQMNDDDLEGLKRHLKSKHDFRLAKFDREFMVNEEYSYESSSFKSRQNLWTINGLGRLKGQRKNWPLTKTKYSDVWLDAVTFLRELLPDIWYFPNFLFDFPSKIYLAEIKDESSANKFYRVLIQDILDSLNLEATVEEHLTARALSGVESDRRSLDSLVLQMCLKITEDVFAGWNKMFGRQVDKKVFLRVEVEDRPTASGSMTRVPYIEFQIEDNNGYCYVHERSLGFRWFFVFLLLTSFRGSRKGSSSGLLFLFDEPASNLHQSAQAQLRSSFPKLVENCRIIYTTHSHHMIDPDWLEQTYVVSNRGLVSDPNSDDYTAKRTDITMEKYRSFVANHPNQSLYFQPILDVLDYAPSRLELVSPVVVVEGKNDYYSARFAQQQLSIRPSLRFMPAAGAGTLDQLIALYLGWGRDFVVLLDSDGEGEFQKTRYLDKFGLVVENQIFTLADFVPILKGKSLEAVYQPDDRAAVVSALGGDPNQQLDKKSFNRMIQEALIRGSKIQLSDAARDIYVKLLDGLDEKLVSAARHKIP